MVSAALREVMLLAEGAGRLAGDGILRGSAGHPVCGDELEFDCALAEDRVVDLAWRATGCPATMAVAASVRAAVLGHPIDEAVARVRFRLDELGGLEPTERHALTMAERALREVAS